MYDPSLLLSPHLLLLAVLFKNRAFQSESLNDDPHLLSTLKVHPNANQLRLTLKDEFSEVFLFRQCEKTVGGIGMPQRPITQSMTGGWIKSIGKLLGFEHNTIAYSLRYFAGNRLDQGGTFMDPNISMFARLLGSSVCSNSLTLTTSERELRATEPRAGSRPELRHLPTVLPEPPCLCRPLGYSS